MEVVHGVVALYQGRQAAGTLSEADAKAEALRAVKALRYEKTEYFWINDLGAPFPKMVMHPTVQALDGKVLDSKNFDKATSMQPGSDGKAVELENKNLFVSFNAVVNQAGHGFVRYMWPKPKTGGGVTEELFPKLSYVKKFEPWGWVIGSGIYIDHVDRDFRDQAIFFAGVAFCLLLIMGGEAGVDSVLGAGSTFWFTAVLRKHAGSRVLPLPDSMSWSEELMRELAGSRILVVDDEPINREVAREELEQLGLVVDEAADGAQAVACAEASRYSLILMDMQMPVVNGLEATRRIRQLPGYAEVPIIAITANVFPEYKVECFSAGMDDFLAKPFDAGGLRSKCASWLTRRKGDAQ